MLNEQEMQFADPDWQPTGPLSAQPTGPLSIQPMNTVVNAPMPGSMTGPGSGQAYDASQLASLPAYGQGYQGLWPGQSSAQNPLQQFSAQQAGAQQASVTRRGSSGSRWWIWVIIAVICISLGSGIFHSTSHSYPGHGYPGNKYSGPQQGIPGQGKQVYDLQGATQLNINDLSGDITVQVVSSNSQSVIVNTDDGSQPQINYQGQSMVLTSNDGGAITVTIPLNVALNLSAGENTIEVDGFAGQLIAQTDDGQITLNNDNLSQGSSLNTNSGTISLGQQSTVSDTTITSSSGAITLDQANLSGTVTLSTGGNGTISYSGTLDPEGKYQFTTDGGDIDLTLPQSTAMQVKLSQKAGHYSSAFSKLASSAPQASVGITTNSGNITISQL